MLRRIEAWQVVELPALKRIFTIIDSSNLGVADLSDTFVCWVFGHSPPIFFAALKRLGFEQRAPDASVMRVVEDGSVTLVTAEGGNFSAIPVGLFFPKHDTGCTVVF